MILEGIVTTLDERGAVNISPMGPHVTEAMDLLLLRPFQTSRTYANLKRHGEGVLHVTDDVELLAHAAVGALDIPPRLIPAEEIEGLVLADACRSYEFRVERIDDSSERASIEARVVRTTVHRDFFGFNRAKHAVVEAAILATRLDFLPRESILEEMARLAVLVEKTAGPQEERAFEFLQLHIQSAGAAGAGRESS